MSARIADLAHRRPGRILVVALAFLAVAALLGGDVADRLVPAGPQPTGDSESARARDRLGRALGYDADPTMLVLAQSRRPVRSRAVRSEVTRLAGILRADRGVGHVETFYDGRDSRLISNSGHATLLAVYLDRSIPADRIGEESKRIGERLRSRLLDLRFGGFGPAASDQVDTARQDLVRAELFAFPLLFLLLVLVFRGLVAALLPLSVGVVAVLGSFLGLKLLNELTPISIFALNVTTALGLGLAIDYSLLLVSRYREEIAARGAGPRAAREAPRWLRREALRATLQTAGRTVVYSGLIVAAAMAALIVFPQQLLHSLGYGGAFVAVLAMVSALVVVPALLALLGERINALSMRRGPTPPDHEGRLYRLSHFVMRRPLPVAAASAGILIALGIPFLSARYTGLRPGDLPESQQSRQVDDILRRDFSPNSDAPVNVAVALPRRRVDESQLDELRRRIELTDGTASVSHVRRAGPDTAFLQVTSRRQPFSDTSMRLVEALRDLEVRYPLLVGGQTAAFIDFKQDIRRRLPLALAIIGVAMLVLLFLMTGSAILPLKAMLMNALTLSAAFGVLILIFQDGRAESLLDYRSQNGIDTPISVLLFAVVFGLSTDYGVFLLARIKELRDRGANDTEAIALGMQTTGRVVTSAALLLSVAVGSLVTASIIFVKEAGFGIAFAVLLDASLVRLALVPSLMRLMGRWNWWAPKPLRLLHARLGLSDLGP